MLSQRSRYALKALLFLAEQPVAAPVSIGLVSQRTGISRKFLEAILNDLKREGLVASTRGKLGGYRLARAADAISFADVIRASEGPLALFPCASVNFYRPCADCEVETCALRQVLARARAGLVEVLENSTLSVGLATDAAPDGNRAAVPLVGAAPPVP